MELPAPAADSAADALRLPGAARALALLELGRPLVAVCPEERSAVRLHGDLGLLAAALGSPPPLLLPAPGQRLLPARLAALERVAAGDAAVVVCGPEAAVSPLWEPRRLRAAAVEVRRGGELDAAFLAELLGEMGYRRVAVVADAGELAPRAGRLDVFPAAASHPVRVEVSGGAAAGLRAFDVGTQRSFRDLEAVTLLPAREPGEGPRLCEALPGHMVVHVGAGATPTLPSPLEGEGMRGGDPSLAERGGHESHPSPEGRGEGKGGPRTSGSVLPGEVVAVEGFGLTARERRGAGEPLAAVGERLAALAAQGWRVLVAGGALGEAERVCDLLSQAGHVTEVIEAAGLRAHAGPVAVVRGDLSGGFAVSGGRFLAVTAAELFGPRPPARVPRASALSTLIASLDELEPGDHVVHLEHGIGRFSGIERHPGGADFLRLEYARGGRLLLPVERIDQVRRYLAPGGRPPRLDAIGGTGWRQARTRAAAKARETAAEYLRLAAERAASPGTAHPPDGKGHREFAEAFAHEETADQRAAIAEIGADLEAPHPMDRLLCGDVGYGKTEVAMRAAFKVVAGGRQAAVVAPTTVLAEQHAEVFAARLAPFGVPVVALTGATPPEEERAGLALLASGEPAVAVGTHRLLGAGVRFGTLGLVVVDEEQRFGAAHKERARALAPGVDLLTMTATPIPRTLHLALGGLRELSTLETPPEERLAVRPIVAPFSWALVSEALVRELGRGGQAFFVHNRIETIARVGEVLQVLLPGRRIGLAHARLPAAALEATMRAFRAGELDVLLASAIVGAGLDVPRANTIVVDRADRFGLAELYQLKGRVGRSDQRAFAYFLTPPEDRMTEEARERLSALEDLAYLGAGFRVALRDLELRGAGDLLGPEQSGFVADVGLDLYLEMLRDAAAQLRGEPPPPPEPVVELRAEAHLPAGYVDDPALRLSLLRRIIESRDEASVADLRRELADRFGPPPPEAARLLDAAALRAACRAARVARLLEVADRRFRVEPAGGREPSGNTLDAVSATLGAPVEEVEGGFEADLAKRSREEIALLLPRALALLG